MMVPPQPTAALVFFLLVSGDAKVGTRLASGFNRKNRELEGATSIWNGTLTSAALCLSACMKLNCLSLTFGRRECTLYATYLCHPQDRFHLSLVSSPGITYFDLYSDLRGTMVLSKKEACVMYGRCLEKCEEGSWTTTSTSTTTTAATTTTTTTKATSKDLEGANRGLGSSDKNNAGGNNRGVNSSTESSADNTATVTSSPGPTMPPEKLGSGLLLIQSPMNFDDALNYCKKNNMSLAMPQTKREHAILVKAMKRRSIGRMWIGVRKITASGMDATYVDGRNVSRQLLLWGDGQPNNSRGGQICVEMNASLKHLWNDFDCLYRNAFVCR